MGGRIYEVFQQLRNSKEAPKYGDKKLKDSNDDVLDILPLFFSPPEGILMIGYGKKSPTTFIIVKL